MQYSTIKGVSLPVSRLVFGCMTKTMLAGGDAGSLLDAALECGINCFDTAEVYGLSELSLGRWIRSRGVRKNVVVLTKGCHPRERDRVTPSDLNADIEQSFERLDTDFIDIYLLHRDDPKLPVGTIMEAMHRYVVQGYVGAIGVSNWTIERIREANIYAQAHGLTPITVNSPNYSLARQMTDVYGWGCTSISGDENAAGRAYCHDQSISVIAYSSLANGFLSGKAKSDDEPAMKALLDPVTQRGYLCRENLLRLQRCEKMAAERGLSVPQLALAYVLSDPIGIFPAVKCSNPRHLHENLAALAHPLTEAECAWVDLRI